MTRSTMPSVFLLCGACGRSPAWEYWQEWDVGLGAWIPARDILRAVLLRCSACDEVHSREAGVDEAGLWGVGSHDEMEIERRRIEHAGRARWVDYRPEARKRMPAPRFVVSLPGDPAFRNQLTFKQRQVLALYALGLGRRQIRSNLGLLHRTLRSREDALMENLGVNTIRDALDAGRRRGIVA